MPVLEIPHGEDPRVTELRITGIMLYPHCTDAAAHKRWMLRNMLVLVADQDAGAEKQGAADKDFRRDLGSWLGAIVHDYGGWGALANAALIKQTKGVQSESRDRLAQGKQAGALLLTALQDEMCNGVKDAAHQLMRGILQRARRDELTIPRGESADAVYNHIWPQFRPAAHLWAAYLAPKGFSGVKPGRWLSLSKFRHGGLHGFIEIAESIRLDGAKRLPRRGPRQPILPPDQSWTLQQLAL